MQEGLEILELTPALQSLQRVAVTNVIRLEKVSDYTKRYSSSFDASLKFVIDMSDVIKYKSNKIFRRFHAKYACCLSSIDYKSKKQMTGSSKTSN